MFKNTMIQKMTGPDAISASALSKHVDVSQATVHMPEIYCTFRNAYIRSHIWQVFPAMLKSEFLSRQLTVSV